MLLGMDNNNQEKWLMHHQSLREIKYSKFNIDQAMNQPPFDGILEHQ